MRLRLYIKFALWLLLSGLLPLAILGTYSLFTVKKTIEENTRKTYLALSAEMANEVARIIHSGIDSVGFLAENPVIASPDSARAVLEEELTKTQSFHPIIKDLTLLDGDGGIRASARYSFRGDWRTTNWYRYAITGQRVFTGVHAVLYPFEVVMTIAVPIFDEVATEVVSVLVGQLNMEPIWKIFTDIQLGEGAVALLMDNNGTVVASPDSEQILTSIEPSLRNLIDENRIGHIHFPDEQGERLVVYAALPSRQAGFTANWHVLISQPVHHAYAATADVWRGLILTAMVAVVAVAVVSTILSRHINSRIKPLIIATRSLGKKAVSLPLDRLGHDEIGELGRAFATAADALTESNLEVARYQERLEELVERRTKALQEANALLEERIAERIRMEKEREELEQRFRQSQKMEAVGTLAGGIAHDFNNILQMISGQVQLLLLQKKKGDEERDVLLEIDQTTTRASELIRRLLTFSRKMETAPKRMNINTMIESTVKLLRRTIPRMIAIETKLAHDLDDIMADYNQMEQVLMNLAANSGDAMPEGGELTIETQNIAVSEHQYGMPELAPGRYVLLRVADTGTGMDESVKKRIFEPFFTSKEIGKGTGLGLSTVYGIVEDHEGYIVCTSRIGEGTSFTLYFPALEHQKGLQPQQAGTAEEPLLGGLETILVVDDEEIVREIARDMLSRFGYKVYLAENGENALQLLAIGEVDIDLLITDLDMPGMGGERLIASVLQEEKAMKIIVASGYLSPTVQKGDTGAADAFLQKPYQLKTMLHTIRWVLDK